MPDTIAKKSSGRSNVSVWARLILHDVHSDYHIDYCLSTLELARIDNIKDRTMTTDHQQRMDLEWYKINSFRMPQKSHGTHSEAPIRTSVSASSVSLTIIRYQIGFPIASKLPWCRMTCSYAASVIKAVCHTPKRLQQQRCLTILPYKSWHIAYNTGVTYNADEIDLDVKMGTHTMYLKTTWSSDPNRWRYRTAWATLIPNNLVKYKVCLVRFASLWNRHILVLETYMRTKTWAMRYAPIVVFSCDMRRGMPEALIFRGAVRRCNRDTSRVAAVPELIERRI